MRPPEIERDADGRVLWYAGSREPIVWHAMSLRPGQQPRAVCQPQRGLAAEPSEPAEGRKCHRCRLRMADWRRSREENQATFKLPMFGRFE